MKCTLLQFAPPSISEMDLATEGFSATFNTRVRRDMVSVTTEVEMRVDGVGIWLTREIKKFQRS